MLFNNVMSKLLTVRRLNMGKQTFLKEMLYLLITIRRNVQKNFEKNVKVYNFRLFNYLSNLFNFFFNYLFSTMINVANLNIDFFKKKVNLVRGDLEK